MCYNSHEVSDESLLSFMILSELANIPIRFSWRVFRERSIQTLEKKTFSMLTLLVAALWLTAQAGAEAQKPRAAARAKGSASAAVQKSPGMTDEVGSVNGKKVTWSQLIDYMRITTPDAFSQAVAQAVGKQALPLFDPAQGKQTVTVTRDEVLAAMRKEPAPAIGSDLTLMLNDMALEQEAAKYNMRPTPQQVEARVEKLLEDLRKQGVIPQGVTNEKFLESQHVTRKVLRDNMRRRLITWGLIQKNLEKELGRPVAPEDFIQVRHILIRVPFRAGNKEEDRKKAEQETLEKATKIAADIKAGTKTFEAAAKESSQDFATKEKGGDMGAIIKGQMSKDFDEVAFKLRKDEISAPIKIGSAFEILQVTRTGAEIAQADRDASLEKYCSDQRRYSQYMNDLTTTKARIVNKLGGTAMAGRPRGGMRPPGPRIVTPGNSAPTPPVNAPPGAPPAAPGGEKK